MLTGRNVICFFLSVGLLMVPLGVGILLLSAAEQEYAIDYTDCRSGADANATCADAVANRSASSECACAPLDFRLETPLLGADVTMYYALTNFHQNHRRYIYSRDLEQLRGDVRKEPGELCEPFAKDPEGRPYVPCGAIANSMFSGEAHLHFPN